MTRLCRCRSSPRIPTMSGFPPANAAADELREAALAIAVEAAESLAADVVECLNRRAAIGAAAELSPNFGDGLKDQAAAWA